MRRSQSSVQAKLKRAAQWLVEALRALNAPRTPALAPVSLPARRRAGLPRR
ncbi:MAG: hypothetical protein NZM11_09465 [Anaerolineales bacterium]|nr:hypothetical protein [Anaerolineales bacterium]